MSTTIKEDGYYINNDDMIKEVEKYSETGVISEELGEMFIHIATNFANKGNFSGYSWKSDMIGEAVYTCVRYVHNFDIKKQDKPNPFAYFSQICYHSFINYIKKQKKHSNIKDVCYNNAGMLENEFYIKKSINYEILK
jgi:hypothetical protein